MTSRWAWWLVAVLLGCGGLLDLTPQDDAEHLSATEAKSRGYTVPDAATDVSVRTASVPDVTVVWQRFDLDPAAMRAFVDTLHDHETGPWTGAAPHDWPKPTEIDADKFTPPTWWTPTDGAPMFVTSRRATEAHDQGSGDLVIVSGSTVFRNAWAVQWWGIGASSSDAPDLSTDEGVRLAYNRAAGASCDQVARCLCVRRWDATPEVVIVGAFRYDAGCADPGAFVHGEWYPTISKATLPALDAVGWKTAEDERRAKLAVDWANQGLRAFDGPLLTDRPSTLPESRPFSPPTVESDGAHGVRISGWVVAPTRGHTREEGRSSTDITTWDAHFDASGALVR
jgi:hypothetical protein